jgi:serine/threonine protein kinase
MQNPECPGSFTSPECPGSFTSPECPGSFTSPECPGSFTSPECPGSFTSPDDFHDFGNVPIIEENPCTNYDDWKRIGGGGTGEVFSCFDRRSHKRVAIKRTPDSDNVYYENLYWSLIPDFPHIVKLFEVYIWENYVYAVMELMPSNLTAIIPMPQRHMPPLPAIMLLRIIHMLILAVKHLHDNGIAHGDLKSDNVLLDEAGNIKLADFGVSTQHGEIHPNLPLCGTFSWKPPNSMRPETASPFKDDIWSLGILILELFGVDPPFMYEFDVSALIHHISNMQAPPPLPNLKCYGEDFELRMHGLLNECLKMDPTERFSSEELLFLFESIFKNHLGSK